MRRNPLCCRQSPVEALRTGSLVLVSSHRSCGPSLEGTHDCFVKSINYNCSWWHILYFLTTSIPHLGFFFFWKVCSVYWFVTEECVFVCLLLNPALSHIHYGNEIWPAFSKQGGSLRSLSRNIQFLFPGELTIIEIVYGDWDIDHFHANHSLREVQQVWGGGWAPWMTPYHGVLPIRLSLSLCVRVYCLCRFIARREG